MTEDAVVSDLIFILQEKNEAYSSCGCDDYGPCGCNDACGKQD